MADLPHGLEEIHREEFARMFGRVVGARLYIAPVVGTLAIALGLWDATPWRKVLLIGVALAAIVLSTFEAWRYRREGMTPRAADLNLAAGAVGQVLGSAATGGLESPFLPLMLVLSLMASLLMVERRGFFGAVIAFQVASLWAMGGIAVAGAVPGFNLEAFGGGVRGGHPDLHLWVTATLMTLGVGMSTVLGRSLRRVFDGMLWRSLSATDRLRKEHEDRSRELVALSGEIAHELKNPMSSVKGLSALLAQNVSDAKGAERLQVLRQEVDRMQAVLEEFLNFSRPLVPLSVERADLAELCAEIAVLHEGLAREKGVSIAARGAAVRVRCDPRKVRQILVNLVQNALEASPAGRAIELSCEGAGGRNVVRVLDRGPGLSPEVLPRLFEPGATTKPKGTGLGLTIARALARQHGGDLTLGPRDGGGCAAVLTLPDEPVLAQDAARGASA